ncbi:transposase [Levilactobacillus suantsaii]|nr:transposase [Levilactobacillus suantsaii]
MLIRNRQLIKNMPNSSLSNGPIEGINRNIKQIKRTADGYRNWQSFSYHIQLEFKIRLKKRNPTRK